MQIDYALILSAGMGTRMGEIGKKLPKPLWPIFSKELLDLQMDYCLELGVKKVFINTHFLATDIEKYVRGSEKFSGVTILHEDPLLDSGGAIHNFAQRPDVNYKGNVLLVNADQFLFFDQRYIKDALNSLKNSRASLFGITVDKAEKYNETILKDGQLSEIQKPSGLHDYITYSGLGLLKLDGLERAPGITKFFETVANFKKERVEFLVPDKFEYWDFGTAEIYFNSIKKIFHHHQKKETGMLMDFLYRNNVFNGREGAFFNPQLNSINLEGFGVFERNSILGKSLVQSL